MLLNSQTIFSVPKLPFILWHQHQLGVLLPQDGTFVPSPAGFYMGAMAMVELEVVSGRTYVSPFSYISIRQVDATGP